MCVIYCKHYGKAYEPQDGICPACGGVANWLIMGDHSIMFSDSKAAVRKWLKRCRKAK